MTRLRKLDSIVVPKVVISTHTMQLGKVICFAFSDGTVQYRDRVTMNEVYNEHNVNSIMSPHQVGFQFTNETPCEYMLPCARNIGYLTRLQVSKLPFHQPIVPLFKYAKTHL